MAIAGALEIQLTAGIARLSADMNNVNRVVGTSMKKVESAVASAKTALAGIGIGLGIGAFAAYINKTIEAADKLNDLRIRTGLTGQELIVLEGAAVRGGASLDVISDVTSKLSKRFGGAEIATGEAAKALSAMGMSATRADGSLKGVNEIMREAGDIFAQYEDGADKAALATALFGKGGDKLIPVIEGIRETEERFKRLGITIDEDVITAADKFKDTMEDVHALNAAFARQLIAQMLPYMQQLVDAFVEFKAKGNDAGTALKAIIIITKIAVVGFIGLYTAIAAASEVLAGIGIANIAFYSGNWSQVGPALADGWDRASKRFSAYASLVTALDPFGSGKPGDSDIGGTAEKERRRNAPKLPDLKGAAEIAKAKLAFDLDMIKRETEAMMNAYANQQRIVDAQHAAGLIEEGQYFEERRIFLALNTKVQEDGLIKEILRLRDEKLIGKEKIDNDRKIADARFALSRVYENAAASERVISIEQRAALVKTAQAYLQLQQAQREQLITQERAQQLQRSGIGIGNQERDRIAARAQIEDKYTAETRRVLNEMDVARKNGPILPKAQEEFDARLGLLKEYQAKSLLSYDENYAAILAKQSDWSIGMREALKNYYDESRNVAKQTEQVFTNAFRSMEDALLQFTTTGKLDFKSLVNSIIADIARIEIRKSIANTAKGFESGGLMGALSALFGRGGSNPGNAGGGVEGLSSGAADAFSMMNMAAAANGADWMVGGGGGVDSRVAQFRVTPGERIIVQTPEQQAKSGNVININVNQSFPANATRSTMMQAAAEANRALQAGARNL